MHDELIQSEYVSHILFSKIAQQLTHISLDLDIVWYILNERLFYV